MLHRSFKPAKCKTALKLAVSRIKLLKNKREAQLKQLRRELAKLLEAGQDQTARIRVEHVIREEKTMAAYDLVEIYCELMAARLPMIESQKNCPIDLKEAVTSLIFATPRCSDLPELVDVKKQITSKYGKEFVSAAVELRPDCGVNRLLVEKLSVKAPDGPTKNKILAAIAEEHNIKWEPKSFVESDKYSQDLSVGPNTFEKASYAEPSQVHDPPVHDEKGPPSLHASSQLNPMHDASTNSYEENTSGAARKASGNHSTTPGMSDPEIRSSGPGNQETDFRDSYSGNKSSFPVGRQNWNMEFKDAASAAQAAAESAERANMAARAAAEFSNRENMSRQHSSGSHSSSGKFSRDEVPQRYAFHDDKHHSTAYANRTSHRSSSGMHNERTTAREQDNLVGAPNEHYRNSHQNVVKHDRSPSLKSGSSFVDDQSFTYGSQMTDTYQHSNSLKQENDGLHEMSTKNQASRTEEDFVTELHGDDYLNAEDNDQFGYARSNRQYRKASSSNLSIPSDDHNYNLNLSDWTTGKEDIFFTEGNTQTNTVETSSYNDTSVAFDDSGSEDDGYKFDDQNYKGGESSLFFSSPGNTSKVDKLGDTSSWRHGQNIDEKETSSSMQSHFSVSSERLTKSEVSYEKEDQLPVTFDDSDDPGSDSEVDLVKSKVSGTSNYGSYVPDQNAGHGALGSSSRSDKNLGTDRKSSLSPSSAGSDTVQEHFEKAADTAVTENYGYDDLLTNKPYSKARSSILDLDPKANSVNDTEISGEEDDMELNYGTLKGGLRNKSYWRPPYVKNTSNDVSSSLGDTAAQNERSLPTVRTSVSSDAPVQDKYRREVSRVNKNAGLRTHNTSSGSDRYNLVANSQETSSTTEPRIQTEQVEAKKKSSSRASIPYFDSDDGDSGDEHPRQNSARAQPVSRISRRTSASPKTGSGLSSKNAPSSETPASPGTGLGWKSSRVSSESKSQKAPSTMKSPEKSLDEEITTSSATVQPSSSLPKTVRKDSEEGQDASKSQNSDGETPSKQKATAHIHPKLPDYDSFAAHFLSLKKDRQ